MQRLEVSGVVRPIYGSLGVKRLNYRYLRQLFLAFSWQGKYRQVWLRPNSTPGKRQMTLFKLTSYQLPIHISFRTEAFKRETVG